MYTQIIRRRLKNEGIYNEAFSQALSCIENSLVLINANLADLKALKNSEMQICDIKTILINAVKMSKAYVVDKVVNFSVNISESANVLADENKLLSCFVNILKNGIEAIDIQGIISVSLKLNDKNAVIHLSNNGFPIPDDIRDNIFNYGYTTKDYGSGYGLCLTKQYIESQNAHIELLKSDEDETTFEIVIPLAI